MAIKMNSMSEANIYTDGSSQVGKVKMFEIDPLKIKKEDVEALGIFGEIEIPVGVEKLKGSFEANSYYPELATMASDPFTWHQLQARANVRSWDNRGKQSEVPFVTFVTVGFDEVDIAKHEKQKNKPMKYGFTVYAVKQIYDGETILEYDVINNILKVRGRDILEQMRLNIGT